MTPERWQQVKRVLERAMELPVAERKAFVDRECANDTELRAETEPYLDLLDDTEGSFQEAHAAVNAEVLALADSAEGQRDNALRSMLERALGQHYEIVRFLGRGAMGAVYLACERSLDRLVAIKVLWPDLAAVKQGRQRFGREARIAASLSHPAILPLYTFGEVGGVWYFVMGYVPGESLAERLRLEGRLSPEEARRILTELADALDCAHSHDVVHRDIKPANILLDRDTGRAKLADFGISKIQGAQDGVTESGARVGTLRYMSPEQMRGDLDVDGRSDIYSLGLVGYAMLVGREPFWEVSSEDLPQWRVNHDPSPLALAVPSAPKELVKVVTRCLARDRTLRWQSAKSLKEALDRIGFDQTHMLPESLRDLPGFGPYAFVWAVTWIAVAISLPRFAVDRALLLLIALLVPVGLALHVWNIGRHGLGALQLARISCWPPQWWGMWWPSSFRRPGDLWSRLPRPAWLARVVLSTFFILMPALALVRHRVAGPGIISADDLIQRWLAVGEGSLVAVSAALIAGSLIWALRRGLSFAESVYVLFGGTAPSPVWRRRRVAALLAPAGRGVRPPDRDTPSDFPRAVDDVVRLLPREAATLGAEAKRAARDLHKAIARADRDVAALARDASAEQLDRLSVQLAALEEESRGEIDERRELRGLLLNQRDVLLRMRGRHELALRRRARLFDLLRGLWTQLCDLPEVAAGNVLTGPAAKSLRALCAEIAEELEAAPVENVTMVSAPSEPPAGAVPLLATPPDSAPSTAQNR